MDRSVAAVRDRALAALCGAAVVGCSAAPATTSATASPTRPAFSPAAETVAAPERVEPGSSVVVEGQRYLYPHRGEFTDGFREGARQDGEPLFSRWTVVEDLGHWLRVRAASTSNPMPSCVEPNRPLAELGLTAFVRKSDLARVTTKPLDIEYAGGAGIRVPVGVPVVGNRDGKVILRSSRFDFSVPMATPTIGLSFGASDGSAAFVAHAYRRLSSQRPVAAAKLLVTKDRALDIDRDLFIVAESGPDERAFYADDCVSMRLLIAGRTVTRVPRVPTVRVGRWSAKAFVAGGTDVLWPDGRVAGKLPSGFSIERGKLTPSDDASLLCFDRLAGETDDATRLRLCFRLDEVSGWRRRGQPPTAPTPTPVP